MNIKNKTELDFIDIFILFLKNIKTIIIFILISLVFFLLYYFIFHKHSYESKIEITSNNEIFLFKESPIVISDVILDDKYISEFYNYKNYNNWSKNISNLYFLKSEFFGSKNDIETFYRAGRDSRMYNITKSKDNSMQLYIYSNDQNKIKNILSYSYYVNEQISDDLYNSLRDILSDYTDDFDKTKNIETISVIQLIMSNIEKNNVYDISNPSLPRSNSQSIKKILILFILVGLFLSFLYIICRHFFYLKTIQKKYK